MAAFSEVLLPAELLVYCFNAAWASLAVCAIAIALSRRSAWSLPLRHALLVAALGVSLLAPLLVPWFQPPSLWSIRAAEIPDRPSHSADTAPRAASYPRQTEEPRGSESLSTQVAEATSDGPATAGGVAARPVSVSVLPPSPAVSVVQPAPANLEWVRVIGTLLCIVWVAGMMIGAVRALVGFATLRRWVQTTTVANSPLLAAATRRAADGVGLRRKLTVYCSQALPAPVALGLLRPRIVVPADIETSLEPAQLRAVILHEMAHIARGDLWTGLMQQIALVVYWWNPLVRLANHRLADCREQICDDIAVRELPEPSAYAAALIDFAERCSLRMPVPATLGIGSSPAGQLERRIRRIVSSSGARCVRLTRPAAIGVSAAVVLMTATIVLAQVQVRSPAEEKPADQTKAVPPKPPSDETETPSVSPPIRPAAVQNPTLHDLIQQMAAYERMYFPFDIQEMETFRFPDDLSPQERAQNLRADGRKRQRLMEYAQLAKRIWRTKETDLVDDEVEQGPYERFSDGERIIQVSPSSLIINGNQTLEHYISNRKNEISNYLLATPLYGVFCLSAYGAAELFSDVFQGDEEAVELAWDNGDAKLTFVYGKPHWNTRYVLWLSRTHAWHPVRLQRYWDAEDKFFFDEWEVTRFVPHGKLWRVAEGTHRYRDLKDRKLPDPKIKYSMDFKVLAEKYGSDVDEKQFKYEIPAGAKVREEGKQEAEPPPPAKTREITVTVIDVSGNPIPRASVRLPASRLRDLDLMTTDEKGVAHSTKAPADDVTVHITAAGYRPVTWIMGDVNELRAIMVPLSHGVVVDEGKPVADAWITNESLQIRADGFTYVPSRDWDGRDKDWTDADGRFELKTNLTLRRRDAVVPLVAVNPDRDKMAIRFVAARDLGQQQELALQSVCHVSGHCLLAGMTESVQVGIGLESSTGQYIGFLSTRRELTPAGLRVDFQLRLPPGDYVLKSGQSSHHSGFEIPFAIPAGRKELDQLDLGTKTVSPAGAVALRGKPAPTLDVRWRGDQQLTWDGLRGKVVVLDFWGTWCRPCVADMPMLMEIYDQFREKPVQWLSIHTPDLKAFEELDGQLAKLQDSAWNKRELPFTTVIDQPLADRGYSGKTSQSYGVAEWPTLIIVDQQGNVVGPVQKNKLAATISRLLEKAAD